MSTCCRELLISQIFNISSVSTHPRLPWRLSRILALSFLRPNQSQQPHMWAITSWLLHAFILYPLITPAFHLSDRIIMFVGYSLSSDNFEFLLNIISCNANIYRSVFGGPNICIIFNTVKRKFVIYPVQRYWSCIFRGFSLLIGRVPAPAMTRSRLFNVREILHALTFTVAQFNFHCHVSSIAFICARQRT